MKRRTYCLASLGCGAVLAVPGRVSAEPVSAAGAFNDAYVGIEIGGGFGSSRKDFSNGATTGDFDLNGVVGGAAAGYNRAFGSVVVGIEADISGSAVDGTTHAPNPRFTYETKNHWLGTVRPHLGYLLMPATISYITGGLAVGDVRVHTFQTTSGAFGVDYTRVEPGWTVGAGIETLALAPHWTISAGYLYVHLSDATVPSDVGTPTETSFHEHLLRLGANYAF